MTSFSQRPSVPWARVALFVVAATALSYPFRHRSVEWYTALDPILGLPVLQAALEGAGPFVAAAVLTLGFRRQWRPVSFVGSSAARAGQMMAVPPVVFAAIGLPNGEGLSPHLYGLLAGLLVLGYCILEEVGWRGYLQNALGALPELYRFGIVGLLWYGWHLSFLSPGATLAREFVFLVTLVVGSLGLGKVAADTRSVLAAAGFHFLINVLFLSSVVSVPFTRKLLLVGGCLVLWAPILWGWSADAEESDPQGGDRRSVPPS